jgi:hypothetical protein
VSACAGPAQCSAIPVMVQPLVFAEMDHIRRENGWKFNPSAKAIDDDKSIPGASKSRIVGKCP